MNLHLRWNTPMLALLASAAVVAPLVLLELRNQAASRVDFPAALFAMLWLLPTAFFLVAIPAVRSPRFEVWSSPLTLLWRAAAMGLLALAWASLLRDQLPCFLGVPNCD